VSDIEQFSNLREPIDPGLDLMLDMTAESIGEIVEQAVSFTGMRGVPVEDKTELLTDNGPG
jgi:hypothetical protein